MWLEEWTKIGEAAQKREKQEWAIKTPELDNARMLRGFYFIDPEDMENTKKPSKKRTGDTESSVGGGGALQERDKVEKELVEPASGN